MEGVAELHPPFLLVENALFACQISGPLHGKVLRKGRGCKGWFMYSITFGVVDLSVSYSMMKNRGF